MKVMKKINSTYIILISLIALFTTSCVESDNDKEWGIPLIYMPQANYYPYSIPNDGTDLQLNKNYRIDLEENVLHIFLGVYRSGLQNLEEYSVNVKVTDLIESNVTMLPADKFTVSEKITCPAGERDVTFYLSVDLDFIKSHSGTNYGLTILISDPTKYELNEDLSSTYVFINTSDLIKQEGLN